MKISILIPCHNEEKSIKKCIDSCINQTRNADEIIVVNDGSTDRSFEILKSFNSRIKVIDKIKCSGSKSYAQEIGMEYITGDIFISTDGDTLLDRNFVARVEDLFKDNGIVAICGYVKSLRYNWLTACREMDYILTQNIHKLAEGYMDFLMVIPGCAAAFRTDIFRKYVGFDHDTLTEDLDFTYKLNSNNLKIIHDNQAIAYTQDPTDLPSYIKQMRRWYGGGWQNLQKHYRILAKPKCAVELSLIYVEGLAFSLLLFVMPFINITFFFAFPDTIFYCIFAYFNLRSWCE